MSTPPTPAAVGGHRTGWFLFAAVLVVHALSPGVSIGDSRLSSITAWQFLTTGSLHLEHQSVAAPLFGRLDTVVRAGHVLPYFPWPTMLLAAPGALVAAALGHPPSTLSIVDPSQVYLIEIPTAAALVAATTVVLRRVLLDQHLTPRVALTSALVFAFGTSAWSIGSRALWQQTASMLLLTLSVLAVGRLDRSARWPHLLGAFLALSMVVRPTNATFVVCIGLYLLVCRRAFALRVLPALAGVLVVFGVYSFTQYGSPLPPYYLPNRLDDGAAVPFWPSLALNLVSPSRGLLVFDPVLLLAGIAVVTAWRRGRLTGLQITLVAAVAVQWLVIAHYGSTGGHVYGPRLLLDVVPLLVVLAAPVIGRLHRADTPRWQTVGLVVVLGVSLLINASGALLRSARCWNVEPVDVDTRPSRIFSLSDAQFLEPLRVARLTGSVSAVFSGDCPVDTR